MARENARKFHFLREIASGGFGSVFLAKVMHADGFSRLVAIKLLHRRWSDNKEIAQRMRDEARLLGWLRHRNIVDVIELTSIDGRAAVIMEYLEAVDLKAVVQELAEKGERMPPYASLEILSFVASALDAAYNRPPWEGQKPLRVIHRDIKPSNIMVDESGTVKVLDFGVARGEFENRESHTQELQFGSVEYMPPERLFFEPETDRADVYSLGATLFEFLAGERLGKAKGRAEKHAAFLEDRLSFMSARCPLPNPQGVDTAKLIREMCAYNADHRPRSEEVVQRSRALARQMPGPGLSEWAETVIRPMVATAARAPREPNPLDQAVLMEDSTIFGVAEAEAALRALAAENSAAKAQGNGDGVEAGGAAAWEGEASSAVGGAGSAPGAAGSEAPEVEAAPAPEVPRDDARWDLLRRAALAEMEAAAAMALQPGPTIDPVGENDFGDEPTRVGTSLPPTPAPRVQAAPVTTGPAPAAPRKPPAKPVGPLPSIITSAPAPRQFRPAQTSAASPVQDVPRAVAASASASEPSRPVEIAPVGNLPLDPFGAKVEPTWSGGDSMPPSASAALAAPDPVDDLPDPSPAPTLAPRPSPLPPNLTFVPDDDVRPMGLSAGMTMVPPEDSEELATSVLAVLTGDGRPSTEEVVEVPDLPAPRLVLPSIAALAESGSAEATQRMPSLPAESAPAPKPTGLPISAGPSVVAAAPPKPAPVKEAAPKPAAVKEAPPKPAPPKLAPVRAAPPPAPTPEPEPEPAPAGTSPLVFAAIVVAIGVLGGVVLGGAIVAWRFWPSAEVAPIEAPSTTEVAPPSAGASPSTASVAPAAPAVAAVVGPDDVVFSSAAENSHRLSAICGATEIKSEGDVVVPGPIATDCRVTLVKKDRSRLMAEVQKPAAGRYTCFAGDATTCAK